MSAINLTEVDFDQIKTNLIDYLKSTDQFTDYDFDGSNLQVILNLISYQAQLNSYSVNMVANESFLSSATLRNNVVANARMIGYLPTSAKSAFTTANFQYQLSATDYPNGFPRTLQLQPGMVLTAQAATGSIVFNAIDPQNAPVSSSGLCVFDNIDLYEGTYLTKKFTRDTSEYNQKFIIENNNIANDVCYIGDSRYGTIYEGAEGYSLAMGYVDSQFLEDMKTVKVRERLALLIKDSEKSAWMKVSSISSALVTLQSV
mgnify:CR=1 FL=1